MPSVPTKAATKEDQTAFLPIGSVTDGCVVSTSSASKYIVLPVAAVGISTHTSTSGVPPVTKVTISRGIAVDLVLSVYALKFPPPLFIEDPPPSIDATGNELSLRRTGKSL